MSNIRYARYTKNRRSNPRFAISNWGKFLTQMSAKWLASSVRNAVTVYDDTGNDITALLVKESGPVSFEAGGTFPPELNLGQSYYLFTIGTDNFTVHLNAKDGSTGDNPITLAAYNPVTQTLDVGRNFTVQGLVDMIARGVSSDGMRKASVGSVDDIFG